MITGSTLGVVTSYSLGADTLQGHRIPRGLLTSKWVLSPGVPIISIAVDDAYNSRRQASGRIWAAALNALGEVFYLTETPSSDLLNAKADGQDILRHAWNIGRSAYWNLVESSRRIAKEDPYHEVEIHGSYSPRSSSKKMHLSKAQLTAETSEVEKFLGYRPSHFRKVCEGWDMRRRLEVDFAGDDGNGAGEGIFVISCGSTESVRPRSADLLDGNLSRHLWMNILSQKPHPWPQGLLRWLHCLVVELLSVLPGTRRQIDHTEPHYSVEAQLLLSEVIFPRSITSHTEQPNGQDYATALVEEWRLSTLSLKGHPSVEITTSAIDMTMYATLTVDEDPLRTVNGDSNFSSPFDTPSDQDAGTGTNIPGHRARFLAVGTKTGNVIMWNMRASQSTNPSLINEIQPLRTIQTDSPQISCLAVSALHVVHGGNDGLVQSWDPLASTLQPVRTLNSRFSSRARRRLVQAEASINGVGINLYAAGAIVIDPDPTVLRGMVSLGTHLRYWSYSSSAADQYQSKKRRLRRAGERGSNSGPDRFTSTGRGALMDYIATEQEELKKEKLRRAREEARLRGRFGVGLGGLTEEEAIRYAEMVSAEAYQKEEAERRLSNNDAGYLADANNESSSMWSTDSTVTPEGSVVGRSTASPGAVYKRDAEFEQDIEEAIRLSLLDGVDGGGRSPKEDGVGEYDIPIKIKTKKSRSRRSVSSSPSTSQVPKNRKCKASSSMAENQGVKADDLELALKLSMADQKGGAESAVEEKHEDGFPVLERGTVAGKGKGRAF